MVSLKEKYTDLYYIDQVELYEELPVLGMDAIWDEICSYRKMFQVTYEFNSYRFVYTLTPAIYQLMIDTERVLRSYQIAFKNPMMNVSFIDDEQYAYLLSQQIKSLFYKSTDLNQLIQTHPLLFCVLIHSLKLKDELKLVQLCLHRWGLNSIQEELIEHLKCCPTTPGNDQTSILIVFLKRLKKSIEESAQKRLKKKTTELLEAGIESLVHSYPMLPSHSVAFFVHHRQWGYYYCVNDYINATKCSYETARSALNELVELGWYKKIKIGKKYVYTL